MVGSSQLTRSRATYLHQLFVNQYAKPNARPLTYVFVHSDAADVQSTLCADVLGTLIAALLAIKFRTSRSHMSQTLLPNPDHIGPGRWQLSQTLKL